MTAEETQFLMQADTDTTKKEHHIELSEFLKEKGALHGVVAT